MRAALRFVSRLSERGLDQLISESIGGSAAAWVDTCADALRAVRAIARYVSSPADHAAVDRLTLALGTRSHSITDTTGWAENRPAKGHDV
ncbi:MAG: hypothetical protein SGJ19_11220 [Planctomycetia bacterium]|nr:hypothetical protein [Planctomycetia bacterium]